MLKKGWIVKNAECMAGCRGVLLVIEGGGLYDAYDDDDP